MGNWRTVTIQGTCPPEQVEALREACDPHKGGEYRNWHCLCVTQGLMGKGNWPGEVIDSSGNLSERDYSVEDVAEQAGKLLQAAPGMKLKIHCGGDYEDEKCVATITAADGEVVIGPPEVERVRGASEDEIKGRLARSLFKQ